MAVKHDGRSKMESTRGSVPGLHLLRRTSRSVGVLEREIVRWPKRKRGFKGQEKKGSVRGGWKWAGNRKAEGGEPRTDVVGILWMLARSAAFVAPCHDPWISLGATVPSNWLPPTWFNASSFVDLNVSSEYLSVSTFERNGMSWFLLECSCFSVAPPEETAFTFKNLLVTVVVVNSAPHEEFIRCWSNDEMLDRERCVFQRLLRLIPFGRSVIWTLGRAMFFFGL